MPVEHIGVDRIAVKVITPLIFKGATRKRGQIYQPALLCFRRPDFQSDSSYLQVHLLPLQREYLAHDASADLVGKGHPRT